MIHWHHLAWAASAICFVLALLGVFGAGMASRETTAEDYRFPKRCATVGVLLIVLTLVACSTPPDPGIEVRTVEVLVETQKPCPGVRPVRPDPLGALLDDTTAALAKTLAKLAEYSAPGKYADRAEAYFAACPPAE